MINYVSRLFSVFLVSFIVFLSFYSYSPVSFASVNPSFDQAVSSCEARKATLNPTLHGQHHFECYPYRVSGLVELCADVSVAGDPVPFCDDYFGSWAYSGDPPPPPPSNVCSSIPSVTSNFRGPLAANYTTTENVTDPQTGGTVACTLYWTPKAPCVWTMHPEGGWYECYGTLAPTGNPSSAGPGTSPGDWLDAGGNVPSPAPSPVPNPPPPNMDDPPSVCGGSSCYDPGTDRYCATSGGSQVCVPGGQARGDGGGGAGGGTGQGGGCASSGDVTLCAGSPNAPAPPGPPASHITDPQREFQGGDQFPQTDPQTGQHIQTGTGIYVAPGGTSDSGKQSGDLSSGGSSGGPSDGGPAPGSSTGTPGSFGDNGCGTPPSCSGDAVMCGIAAQAHASKCSLGKIDKALAGDGSQPELQDADPSKLDGSTVDLGDVSGSGTGQGMDDSGFGWGMACPFIASTVQVGDASFDLDMTPICDYGPWMRGFLLLLCALKWADIVGRAK